jgi:hypothetical protein
VGLDARTRDLRGGGSAPGLRSAREHAIAALRYEELGRGAFRLQAGARYDVIADTALLHGSHRRRHRRRRAGDPRGEPARSARSPAPPPRCSGTRRMHDRGVNLQPARSGRRPSASSTPTGRTWPTSPSTSATRSWTRRPARPGRVRPRQHPRGAGRVRRVPERRQQLHLLRGHGRHRPSLPSLPGVRRTQPRRAVPRPRGPAAVGTASGNLVLDVNGSYVCARAPRTGDPLPGIPPFDGTARVRYERTGWFASIGWRGAAPRTACPRKCRSPSMNGELVRPQEPTPGYSLWTPRPACAGAGAPAITRSRSTYATHSTPSGATTCPAQGHRAAARAQCAASSIASVSDGRITTNRRQQ